jgi:hypothetical protein
MYFYDDINSELFLEQLQTHNLWPVTFRETGSYDKELCKVFNAR